MPNITITELHSILDSRTIKEGDCWLYKGHLRDNGYGRAYYKGNQYDTHRLSCSAYHGLDLENHLEVARHSCENRNCWNPEHLKSGTHRDNTRDIQDKGNFHYPNTERKSVCKQGHDITTKDKVYLLGNNRVCKICHLARQKKYDDKRRNKDGSRS